MKKALQVLCFVLLGLALVQASANAQVDFTVQAQVPASTQASFSVSQVTPGNPDVFTPVNTTDLDFGQLSLDTTNNIFLPAYYWVIDVGANGAGMPNLQFSYTDTANPNGALNNGTGLGGHGTIAYSEVVTNANGSQTVNLIRGEALQQANTSGGISNTDYPNGFLRISVGVATGDSTLQEGNATPFTATDQPGNYSGTVTITATFD